MTMKKNIFLIFPIFFLIFYAFCSSDFYTSITKVEYVSTNKSLRISSKVNADHLQQALGKKIDESGFDTALNRYIQSNIKISVNDIPVSFTYSSKNHDGSVIWIYYEVSNVSDNISSITLRNNLLIDKFPDQQNFNNFIINGQKKTLVCKKGNETGKINF
ncbi:hypothetical protein C4S76_02970 [Apibacter adventoris]|nr:hypothetical protein C4S76_02970 [Apibacter adventoris]